ncbi:MAG: hypothetical protein U0X20_32690 [Caldilineaceae bacterium]
MVSFNLSVASQNLDVGQASYTLRSIETEIRRSADFAMTEVGASAPPGSMSGELTVALEAISVGAAVATAIINAVKYWAGRNPRCKVTLQYSSGTIELENVDPSLLARLLERDSAELGPRDLQILIDGKISPDVLR